MRADLSVNRRLRRPGRFADDRSVVIADAGDPIFAVTAASFPRGAD
jgi:hypothetical protein